MNPEPKHQSYGWMFVNVAAVAIFLAAAWFGMLKLKQLNYLASRAQMSCVSSEKQLGLAFRGFGIDLGGFPMQLPATNAPVNRQTTP